MITRPSLAQVPSLFCSGLGSRMGCSACWPTWEQNELLEVLGSLCFVLLRISSSLAKLRHFAKWYGSWGWWRRKESSLISGPFSHFFCGKMPYSYLHRLSDCLAGTPTEALRGFSQWDGARKVCNWWRRLEGCWGWGAKSEGHGFLQAREHWRAGQRQWGGQDAAGQYPTHAKQKANSCVLLPGGEAAWPRSQEIIR